MRRVLRSGIAPWKAAPAAPPPARPPTAGGNGAGLRPGPCCGCGGARLGAGAARRLGHSGRLRSARGSGFPPAPAKLQAQPPLLAGARAPESPDLRPKGRREAAGALCFTGSSPGELASPLSPPPSRRCGGGSRSCHSSSRPRRTAEPSRVGFSPGRALTEKVPRSAPSASRETISRDSLRQLGGEGRGGTCGEGWLSPGSPRAPPVCSLQGPSDPAHVREAGDGVGGAAGRGC